MKKGLIFIMLFYCYSVALAQESSFNRRNLLFLEGGGAFAAGVGIGYERYLPAGKLTAITARGGAGLIDHFNEPSFFAGSSFLYGKKFSAEAGLNYISRIDRSNFKSLDDDDEKMTDGIQALVGVRYQNQKNGLFFRIFYVPPFGAFGSWLPYGGVSAGYAF